MIRIEVIPYKTFKERLRIVKEYENNELLNKISDLEEKIEELENDIEQYQEINEELRRR